MNRRLIILGSTGSIGRQTLDVVAHLNSLHESGAFPWRYEVVGLAAAVNSSLLAEQAERFGCKHTALASPHARATGGPSAHRSSTAVQCTASFVGATAAEQLVNEIECDIVLAAVVGSAGLPATLAAVRLGRDIALANKETLVAAGELVVAEAHKSGSRLLPVDSEHAGLWQCVQTLDQSLVPPLRTPPAVTRVVLTASGGPFLTWPKERIDRATPPEALNHPTWSMGPKVTIDSASLMNKALEIIEARWLFNIAPERIEAIIHPQSTVHAIAEFEDGSMAAQMSATDMRHPIQQALAWPHRVATSCQRLDLAALGTLQFQKPDLERFPALALAHRVLHAGGTAGAIFNAANEAAVGLFLQSDPQVPFGFIPRIVSEALDAIPSEPLTDLEAVTRASAQAIDFVMSRAARL